MIRYMNDDYSFLTIYNRYIWPKNALNYTITFKDKFLDRVLSQFIKIASYKYHEALLHSRQRITFELVFPYNV